MKDSRISWTDHTFNPWWGCEKISPACDHCYAEGFAKRVGHQVWGKDAPRRIFGSGHWVEPRRWDHVAARRGRPALVFCASMADVFEDRPELLQPRRRLWDLVEQTPNLRWMLLTKRPENAEAMLPEAWLREPRENVWLGVTAENQRRADERIPVLLSLPSVVHWVSAEPLLEPVSFWRYRTVPKGSRMTAGGYLKGLDWIVAGGESGPHARETERIWLEGVAHQCRSLGIRFHMKQAGVVLAKTLKLKSREGRELGELPEALRVREFPLAAGLRA